jgi:hypothetical protein
MPVFNLTAKQELHPHEQNEELRRSGRQLAGWFCECGVEGCEDDKYKLKDLQ